MLTIYYAGATFLQSWRIKKACNKIAEQLAQQASVVFYVLPAKSEDGFDAHLATSELCINRNAAKLNDILWLRGEQRGCSLRPMQTLHISPWISFPEAPSLVPIKYEEVSTILKKNNALILLLETEVQPKCQNDCLADVVQIEEYGKLIAWKIDSHLALLIETDVEHFTQLLLTTFIQNNYLINDQLPLLRIESVNYEGKPQPFEMVRNHLPKATRTAKQLKGEDWQKHLENLCALSVFANQATEFEYLKNRTEGKTGKVKPDLIPTEKEKKAIEQMQLQLQPQQEQQAEKTRSVTIDVNAKATPSKVTHPTLPKIEPTVTKETSIVAATAAEKANSVKAGISRSPTSTVSDVAPSYATNSAAAKQLKTQPTEMKKSGATVNESRFTTTKVHESPKKPNLQQPKEQEQETATATATPSNKPTANNITTTDSKKDEKFTASSQNSSLTNISTTSIITPSPSPPPPKPKTIEANDKSESASIATTTAATNGSVIVPVSVNKDNAQRPTLKRNKDSLQETKPLNILVYSDSISARESVECTLKDILEKDVYTIYSLTQQQVMQKHWFENTALLIVCGSVAPQTGEVLVDFFLKGGRVLSLCSDILHFVLPTYRTAEVREHELVQFSYDKWQKVKMMHHIFCYQPSPVKKNFSTDSEDSTKANNARKQNLVCPPRSIELKDLQGDQHNLDVKVLGTEEIWNTPSILLANSVKTGGRAIFSQVHLETSPSEFENDESKFSILKQNEKIRLEILSDLLGKHLEVRVIQENVASAQQPQLPSCVYQNAYFLGRHEAKFELLEKLKSKTGADNVISTSKLTMKFCGANDKPPNADTNVLPILIHSCPADFSTVEYFDNLKTNYIGRLVIYAPVVSSSMHVISDLELTHGIAVIPRLQTEGIGRSNNKWLSPLGCAMFSLQLHISLDTPLGSRLPLIQHLIGAALVNTLKSHPLYKNLNIGLKWPNDVYANGLSKIGGLVIKTTIYGRDAIVSIGCGINLDNMKPTVCVNKLIEDYNRDHKQNLPSLKYEAFIALMFNEIERLVEQVQTTADFGPFYKLYYELWLHNDQTITICDKDGTKRDAKVVGIDDYGFLQVRLSSGVVESVQPDGNSFDMLKGLIVPKFN